VTVRQFLLEGDELEAAKRIRDTVLKAQERQRALWAAHQAAIEALDIETKMALRALWAKIADRFNIIIPENVDEWKNLRLDLSYLDQLGVAYLSHDPDPTAERTDELSPLLAALQGASSLKH
jgi:CRISPR/Cas system CSM-associated protein Csm2 small subunit